MATPLVVAIYLVNRNPITPPARYTTSADILIPTTDPKTGDRPPEVPPVLLQGQEELALSSRIRSLTLDAAKLGVRQGRTVDFNAHLNTNRDIMTLSVSAPRPELASAVLDQYVVAYSNGRRQSVLDAALEQQDTEARTIDVLLRKLTDVEAQLAALDVPLPGTVPEGTPLNIPLNTPNATALLLYQRNSILNQIQARQVDFGIQATRATIPADFTTVVQRRTAARIAPPPPSPVVPVLEIIGVGLLLAIAIPVLMDRFDRSITDSRSAASNLRSRVLVSVPAIPRRVHSGYAPRGSSWEGAFRSLAATSISTDNLPQAIMVTSPTGTIHDTVAANFARALANLGVRVALVGTVPRQRWYAHTEPQAQVPEQEEVYDYDDELALDEDRPIAAPTAEESQDPTVPSVASQDTDDSDEPAEADHHDDGSDHPTFVDLLGDAYAGQLPTDVRGLLATVEDVPNLYIVPPSANGDELSLNGLPPLLDAFSRDGIDTVVIGGPAYLEDPDATIIAWSTRNVLWAVEIGHVDSRDAQLAADRLDIAGVAPFGIAVVNRHL